MGPRRRAVVWADAARQQLDGALEYIAQDSPEAASRLLIRILDASASLGLLSDRGRPVPETAQASVREMLVDPFRLVYEVDESEVVIVAVLHQRQDFRRWAERELRRPDAP